MTLPEFLYTVLLKPPFLRRGANAFLKNILPEKILVENAWVHLNPMDPVVSGALALRSYERDEIAFFRKYFQPQMNLVDVGANVGLYTALALARPGFKGRVLCVEPHRESLEYLRRTIAANFGEGGVSLATVTPRAASNRTGTLAFFTNPQNKGDNRIYPDSLLKESEEVECETLDGLCRQYGMERIDFLKIDVQGAEALVLEGAKEILARSPRCILMSEFWPRGLLACGSDPAAYLDLLLSLGFELFELKGAKLIPVTDHSLLIANSGAALSEPDCD